MSTRLGIDMQLLNYEIVIQVLSEVNSECSHRSIGLRHLMVDNPRVAGFGSRGLEKYVLQIMFVQRSLSVTDYGLFLGFEFVLRDLASEE